MEEQFELLPFGQYLLSNIDIPYQEYIRKHLFYSLRDILKTRSEYLKSLAIRDTISQQISENIAKYLQYFHTITSSFTNAVEIEQNTVSGQIPERSTDLIKYLTDIINLMATQKKYIGRVYVETLFDEFVIIKPNSLEEAVACAFAQFSVGSHLTNGLNICVDSLYNLLQLDQSAKSYTNINIVYKPKTIGDFEPLNIVEVDSKTIEYVTQSVSLQIFDIATEIIQNKSYNMIEYAEEQLEICVRILQKCENLEKTKITVTSAILRCVALYLHIYSYRPMQTPVNITLISRLINTIIFASQFSEAKTIYQSLCLIVALVPRDIYSPELCQAVFPKIQKDVKKYITDSVSNNPQLIYSAIYTTDYLSQDEIMPLIEVIPFVNTIFKVDEPLKPIISKVFELFEANPNFPLLKMIIEQTSCISGAPFIAMEFIKQTKLHLASILKVLEGDKVFSGYYMLILAHFIDDCIQSISVSQRELQIAPFADFVIRNKEQLPFDSANLPNSIVDIFQNHLSSEIEYTIQYLSTSIPFIQKKAPAKEIFENEMKFLAALLHGSKLTEEFEKFSNKIFQEKKVAKPRDSSEVPLNIKELWKKVYVMRRLLMNSYQYYTSESKTSTLKGNFMDLSKDITEKSKLILTSKNLDFGTENKIEQITKFITCEFRMEDINEIINLMDERDKIRIHALGFIPKVAPELRTDDEFYLISNMQNDFHITDTKNTEVLNKIFELEKFMEDRSTKVSYEVTTAYSMHAFSPLDVLIHSVKTCKNEIVVNCAWYAIYRNTLMSNDMSYINGLIELGRDFTIEKHQLLSLSILQRLDIAPIEIQKLMEKFMKYKDEPLYIFLSSIAAGHFDSDLTSIPKLTPMMLSSIGEFAVGGPGIITVVEEMVNFIRTHIQENRPAKPSITACLHDSLSKLSKNMPAETIGALIVLGFGGLPPQLSRFYKSDKEYSLLSKPMKAFSGCRVLANEKDFEITKEEAKLFETTLQQIFASLNSYNLSASTIISYQIFLCSIPILVENENNAKLFSDGFIQNLIEHSQKDCGQVEHLSSLIDYFGWLSNTLQYVNFNLFQPKNNFFTAMGINPDTKQTIFISRKVSIDESFSFKMKFNDAKENCFIGYTFADAMTDKITATGISIHEKQYNVPFDKGLLTLSVENIEIKSDIYFVLISSSFDNCTVQNEISNTTSENICPLETVEFSTTLFGCHVFTQSIPCVVTERSSQRICVHAGNRRILQVKERYCTTIPEPLTTVMNRIKAKDQKPNIKECIQKLNLLSILISRLAVCSFWRYNLAKLEESLFIFKFVFSFFKFNLSLNSFTSEENFQKLSPLNLKSYKSFIAEKISDLKLFEKVCLVGVNLLEQSVVDNEYITFNQEFSTPPDTALLFPEKREKFDKDYYLPPVVTFNNESHENLILVRQHSIEKSDSNIYITSNLLKLFKFTGPGLLGVYCKTIFPKLVGNSLFIKVIFERIKSNKKLLFNTARILVPAPKQIEGILAEPLLSSIELISVWTKIKFMLFEDNLIDFEKNFKDRPDPLDDNLFGGSQFSSLIDAFVIQGMISDQSIGIPRYPMYLFAKLWTQPKYITYDLNSSRTIKDLTPNVAEISLIKFDGEGQIELQMPDKKQILQLNKPVKIGKFKEVRINLIGTKGKTAVIQVTDLTKPGQELPRNFRSLINRAEKYYSFMNDLILADSTKKDKIVPIFPGIDPTLTQIRGKIMKMLTLVLAKYNFGMPMSIEKAAEQILAMFVQSVKQRLEKIVVTKGHFIRFDRFKAYMAYNGEKGMTMFRQLNAELRSRQGAITSLAYFTTDWRVELKGEGAIDAGGPRREVFDMLCDEIISHDNIFIESPASAEFHEGIKIPSPKANYRDLKYAGTIMAATVNLDAQQPFRLEPFIWRMLCGDKMTENDMFEIDHELKNSYHAILDGYNGKLNMKSVMGDVLFSYTFTPKIGQQQRENIAKHMVQERMNEMKKAMDPFMAGFYTIIPENLCKTVHATILESIICKEREVTVKQFLDHTVLHGTPQNKKMFVDALNLLSNENRIKLIKFTTGSTALPVGKKMDVRIVFSENQDKNDFRNAPLPHAGTCFLSLVMPGYKNAEVMAAKIITAIEYSSIITDTDIDASMIEDNVDSPTYVVPANRR